MAISSIEFVWAILTFYVLFNVNFSKIEMMVPASFATYCIVGWLYSVGLFNKIKPEDIKDIQIPKWYATFAWSFAVIFTLTSALIYFNE